MKDFRSSSDSSRQASNHSFNISPETFLIAFRQLKSHVDSADSRSIDKFKLANAILELLKKENLNFLLTYRNVPVNTEIVEICADFSHILEYSSLVTIIPKLQLLADQNKELQKRLSNILTAGKYFNYWRKYKGIIITALFLLVIYSVFIRDSSNLKVSNIERERIDEENGSLEKEFESKQNQSSGNEQYDPTEKANTTESGPYNGSAPNNPERKTLTEEEQLEIKRQNLIAQGWSRKQVSNGQLETCYNFQPKSGNVDNYLSVKVGGGTDAAIKVIDSRTDICVKYVYINSRTTYRIKNIPEGKYYLKIAYGKEWYSTVEKGQCIGKFLRSPMYEQGTDILNYNVIQTREGYQIPSYELELDVISSSAINSFDSKGISEDQFND